MKDKASYFRDFRQQYGHIEGAEKTWKEYIEKLEKPEISR